MPVSKEIVTMLTRLKVASELNGRRLDGFDVSERAVRVTSFVDDFLPLRELSAFATLEADISQRSSSDWGGLDNSDVEELCPT